MRGGERVEVDRVAVGLDVAAREHLGVPGRVERGHEPAPPLELLGDPGRAGEEVERACARRTRVNISPSTGTSRRFDPRYLITRAATVAGAASYDCANGRRDRTPGGAKARCTRSIPRSYQDTNGDGVGDLRGIIERLDHLQWLGIRGVWLSPVTVSPNADFGYDVADFYDVDPSLGTLADLDELDRRGGAARHPGPARPRAEPHEHRAPVVPGVAVVARQPEARLVRLGRPEAGRLAAEQLGQQLRRLGVDARRRRPGSTTCRTSSPEQADLNWWNDEVRDEFDRILRFWFDRGVAGFRIDVAHMVVKDRELRDNPPATDDDPILEQLRGQRPVYNENRPEVHDVHRRLRAVADSYDPPRMLVGETFVAPDRGRDPVLRQRRRAQPGVQHPVRAAAVRGGRAAGGDRADRGADARRLHAGVDGQQPRRPPLPDPLGRERPGPGPVRADDAADAARQRVPLRGRRDRHGRHAARARSR